MVRVVIVVGTRGRSVEISGGVRSLNRGLSGDRLEELDVENGRRLLWECLSGPGGVCGEVEATEAVPWV